MLTPQKKHRHVPRELAASVLIHPLKIRVLQQTLRLRKLAAGGGVVTRHSALASGRRILSYCGPLGGDP
jgi:hypothetical protein